MLIFCTMFDSNYISKGLALFRSLQSTSCKFEMYVMAMDRKCQTVLSELPFDFLTVECIGDIEDPELWNASQNRSRAEFCWTCGPYITDYFLHKYSLPEIIYLDSDLMFYASPEIIQFELKAKNASVGLSPHFIGKPLFGKYCVQYVYFRNDGNGCAALSWWKGECLKWCYSKLEDGKYGDQMYLDYMPDLFDGVCEIENLGAGIAYWNMYDSTQGAAPVFFHFSGLNVSLENGLLSARHQFYLSEPVKRNFILPYLDLLASVFRQDMGLDVKEISLKPMAPFTYPIKCISHVLERFTLFRWFVRSYMKIKYSVRKSPYSER